MRFRAMKAFVLAGLILLSIYQTGRLWFETTSDYNFFYSIVDSEESQTRESKPIQSYMIYPRLLAVSLGGAGDYGIISVSQGENERLVTDSIKIIERVLKEGSSDRESYTYADIEHKNYVRMMMPFSFDRELFLADLGVESAKIDFIEGIDEILISPAGVQQNSVLVYFRDTEKDLYYRTTLDKASIKTLNDSLNAQIAAINPDQVLHYLSTKGAQLETFKEEVLLPVSGQTLDVQQEVPLEFSFIKGNEIQQDEFEQFINSYYVNPDSKWKISKADEIRYGDTSIITKYNKQGIFTYEAIEQMDEVNQNVSEAYNIARNFLKRDENLVNQEFQLTGYMKDGNGVHFYFGYSYRDIPIVMPGSFWENYPMKSPMVVTVGNQKVLSYKRILTATDGISLQGEGFEVRYEEALNEAFSRYDFEDNQVDSMYLGYYWDPDLEYAQLQWIVDRDDYFYRVDLK